MPIWNTSIIATVYMMIQAVGIPAHGRTMKKDIAMMILTLSLMETRMHIGTLINVM